MEPNPFTGRFFILFIIYHMLFALTYIILIYTYIIENS